MSFLSKVLFIATMLNGCINSDNPGKSTDYEVILVNPLQTNHITDFHNLVTNIEFLQIETTDSNPVDAISKLWMTDNRILISTWNNEFHAYSNTGKFLFKKTKEGKGKDEILEIRDFSVTKDERTYLLGYNLIYLIDKNGVLISTLPINKPYNSYNPSRFYITENGAEIFSTSTTSLEKSPVEEYSLWINDTISNISKFYLRRRTCNIKNNTFYQSNNNVLISPVIGIDTIYSIIGKSIKPAFYIDFKDFQMLHNEIPVDHISPQTILDYAKENNKCTYVSMPIMNDTYLSFLYYFAGRYFYCFHNMRIDENFIIELSYENVSDLLFVVSPLASYNNKFCYSLPAYTIRDALDKGDFDFEFLPEKRRSELLNQLKSVKETDNPVLMLVTLKE